MIDHDPALDPGLVRDLSEVARAVGLPLAEWELLAQDPESAAGFVTAAEGGSHDAFLRTVDWSVLDARYQARQSMRLCVTSQEVTA